MWNRFSWLFYQSAELCLVSMNAGNQTAKRRFCKSWNDLPLKGLPLRLSGLVALLVCEHCSVNSVHWTHILACWKLSEVQRLWSPDFKQINQVSFDSSHWGWFSQWADSNYSGPTLKTLFNSNQTDPLNRLKRFRFDFPNSSNVFACKNVSIRRSCKVYNVQCTTYSEHCWKESLSKREVQKLQIKILIEKILPWKTNPKKCSPK